MKSNFFCKRFDGYVDEIVTSCQVYNTDGAYVNCEATWDTGAECSVISDTLVKKLNLKGLTKAKMYHAGGDYNIVNCHDVYIGLTNEMIIGPLRVMEGQYGLDYILIGMDIIGSGDLIVTNNGEHTEMTFNIPSTLKTDDIRKLL